MNLSTLQAEIGRLLNDPSNTRWATDVLTSRINQAQQHIQGFTNAVKVTETLTPTANTQQVTLNSSTMDVLDVTFLRSDGNVISLPGLTRQELDYRYGNWRQFTAGVPFSWYYDASNQQLNLVPAPDSANAQTNGLTVLESRVPADLVNSTDIPFDSNNQMIPYHMAIVYWVVSQCWMDDGQPEALKKAAYFRTNDLTRPGAYEAEIKRINEKFDKPSGQSNNILWQKEGGRIGVSGPSKAFPLA